MPNKIDFAHLHLHTDFSLLDGAIQIKPLAERVRELGMKACAMTDHGNIYGAVSFYSEMKKHEIKPLIGCEIYMAPGSRFEKPEVRKGEKPYNHMILLAKDREGYHNLVRLTSKAFKEGFYRKPRIDRELLSQFSGGLIGLSACLSGVPQAHLKAGRLAEAARAAGEFEEILGKGNYFLEIQDHQLEDQQKINQHLIELSRKSGIPLVATNDAHYLTREDYEAHDVMLCIGTGRTVNDTDRMRFGGPQWYVRSPAEMSEIFHYLPDAVTRTMEVAEMCNLQLPLGENHLPIYPIPREEGDIPIDEYFEKVVRQGFEKRRETVWDPMQGGGRLKHSLSEYQERVSREIAMIKRMGFPSYFLIVWDFIKFAKDRSIPVGPGRGCLAGDVPIVLESGVTKPIAEVRVGDVVRSHTGRARSVTALHRYPVDETLVRLRCFYGDSAGVTLTKDHKVLAERGVGHARWLRANAQSTKDSVRRWQEPTGEMSWIQAGELKPGDWVFVPTPKVNIAAPAVVDLAATADPRLVRIFENCLEEARPVNTPFAYSLRDVHRQTGVSRNSLRFIAQNFTPAKRNPRHERATAAVADYVAPQFGALENWRDWVGEQAHRTTRTARFIKPESSFYRVLGRWIADGWMRSDSDLVLGLCFHSDDKAGLDEAVGFFESLGLEPHVREAVNGRKLTQLIVRSRALVGYWRSIFPRYRSTPETKHVPDFALRLPVENVLDVLAGYWAGDGSVGNSQQSKFTATTVSRALADQIRFLAWRSGIPASLREDLREDERFTLQPSYVVTVAKDERLARRLGAPAKAAQYKWRAVEGGLLLQVRAVEEVNGVREVFDLTVEEDHTYQTSSFAVHNSAAGSLVAYCLEITDVDPIQYDLLFERFLNPERVSMPDIDIDFCVHGRGEVINHVTQLYGRDSVCQIITFGTMASKAAIKDVGRALDMPYAEVEKIAKLIPPPIRGRNVSIDQAMEMVPELKQAVETDAQTRKVIDIAKRLEGCARHASVHAAGVVISPQPLEELIPVAVGSKQEFTTQFEMSDLEKTGILKMDFLGLTTLSIISQCCKTIRELTGREILWPEVSLEDPKTYEIFGQGNTEAIFQFESQGMKEICRKLKPKSIEDLSALNALYRPGPLDGGMVDDYIDRYHGKKPVEYLTPEMEETLGNTYGVCVTGDTLVFDADTGARVRIDGLEARAGRFYVQGVDDELRPCRALMTRWVSNGLREVVEVKLRNGARVRLTPDHKVLTEDGWCEIGQLRMGARVASPRRLFVTEEKEYDRDKLRALAYLLADGSLSSAACTADFVSKDAALIEEYRACVSRAFDRVTTRTLEQARGVTRVVTKGVDKLRYHEPNGLVRLLRELGLKATRGGCRSEEKFIPEFVFGLTCENIAFFLASLWDCDGHVGARLCHYKTISPHLARDVQTLLLRLGIHSTIYESSYHSARRGHDVAAYQVTVYHLKAFRELIAPHLVVKAMSHAGLSGEETFDAVSRPILMAELAVACDGSGRPLMRQCGVDRQHLLPKAQRRPRINAVVAGKLARRLPLPRTSRNLNVRWEEIVEIKPAGVEQVYDITVEGIHNFVGNNLILHNCVYQEQIMQLAQRLGGYSLGEADLMRRAMGKKKREEMAIHEEKFVTGCTRNKIPKKKAKEIFRLMAQFADYGFNRSHSVAYAHVAYQTAYLKAHYPEHFYAAVMTYQADDAAKIFKYASELRSQGIRMLPPDVNESGSGFTPVEGAVRYGLSAIKGLGQTAVAAIIEARTERRFRSIFDFAERVGEKGSGKRVLESLTCAGAFDSLKPAGQTPHQWRPALLAIVDKALERGARRRREREVGQGDMFGVMTAAASSGDSHGDTGELVAHAAGVQPWTHKELLAREKEAVGFYVSGHPLEDYAEKVAQLQCMTVADLASAGPDARVRLAGVVSDFTVRNTKKGDRYAFFRLEDMTGVSVKCVLWPEALKTKGQDAANDVALLAVGRLDGAGEGMPTLVCDEVSTLEKARVPNGALRAGASGGGVGRGPSRSVLIELPVDANFASVSAAVSQALQSNPGDCDVLLDLFFPEECVRVRTRTARFVRVAPTPSFQQQLTALGVRVRLLDAG